MLAWRIAKKRYDPMDGRGALWRGGRWNSAGQTVVYASSSFAGAILEILVHSARPRTLPGPHHAVRIEIDEEEIERVDPADVPGWEERASPAARDYGDRWLREARSLVLVVPALPSRPVGRSVLVNPEHPRADRMRISERFDVPWDERLF